MRIGIPIAALVILTGCASQPPGTVQAVPAKPLLSASEAQAIIVQKRAEIWKDPYSIRDARIGDPHVCDHNPVFGAKGACVCLEANARNSFGGYTGMKRTIVVFPDAGGMNVLDGGLGGYEDYCRTLQPFPALDGQAVTPSPKSR